MQLYQDNRDLIICNYSCFDLRFDLKPKTKLFLVPLALQQLLNSFCAKHQRNCLKASPGFFTSTNSTVWFVDENKTLFILQWGSVVLSWEIKVYIFWPLHTVDSPPLKREQSMKYKKICLEICRKPSGAGGTFSLRWDQAFFGWNSLLKKAGLCSKTVCGGTPNMRSEEVQAFIWSEEFIVSS